MSVGISTLELNWSRKLQAFVLGSGPSFVILYRPCYSQSLHIFYRAGEASVSRFLSVIGRQAWFLSLSFIVLFFVYLY